MTCYVYKHYDAQDVCQYIGISEAPHERLVSHVKAGKWEIARVELEEFSDRVQAKKAERRAIAKYEPRHNSMHMPEGIEGVDFICPEVEQFAREVVSFGAEHGFKPSTILQKACLNGKSWKAIVTGKDITMGTASRVRAWMREFEASDKAGDA